MNSQSTPIPQSQADDSSSNLVNDILNELNQTEEIEPVNQATQIASPSPSVSNQASLIPEPTNLSVSNENMDNVRRLNYQMDPNIQPIPPMMMAPRPGLPTLSPEQAAAYAAAAANAQKSSLDGLVQNLMNEVREPLLVTLLFVILNQQIIHKLIIKYIPKLANGDRLSTFGIILLGLIGGVLFYTLRMMNKSE